jgi:hypothetical protein
LKTLHSLSKIADAKMLEQKKREGLYEGVPFITVSIDEKNPEAQTQ